MLEHLLILSGLITLLIFLNGLYVASEFSVISLNQSMLKTRASQGEAWARRYLSVVADSARQDRYIAVAQLGITLASLGLGMYGEHELAALLLPALSQTPLGAALAHSVATFLALAFLTFWHIVVGEMIPKSLALLYPVETARILWWPMRVSTIVLAPLSWVLNVVGNALLVMLGLPVSKDNVLVYSPQELRMVFEESRDEGLLRPERHRLLERIIDFGHRPLRHAAVARTRVQSIPHDAPLDEALRIARSEQFSRYPVVDGDLDNVVGILHVGDLVRRRGSARSVADLMRPPIFLPESLPMNDALDRMRELRSHMVMVLEESGGTAGLVTIEDLLEEIFGEIQDEFDADERPPMVKLQQGWDVSGEVPLDDLFEAAELELSHPAETVSGLVLTILERAARLNDVVTFDRLTFRVTALHKRGVERCVVKLEEEPEL